MFTMPYFCVLEHYFRAVVGAWDKHANLTMSQGIRSDNRNAPMIDVQLDGATTSDDCKQVQLIQTTMDGSIGALCKLNGITPSSVRCIDRGEVI